MSPETVARELLPLLRSGESAESIRKLIGGRDEVRRHFDLLLCRWPKNGSRLRQRVRSAQISEELKREVEKRLREGWSQARVLSVIPVGPGCVLEVSKQIGASYLKPRGRGRRLSPELREKILDAVKAGQRSAEIERQFHVDYDTVTQFRHSLGDFSNRRHRTKLTTEQIQQAELWLRSGVRWRDVAGRLGCALATLQRHVEYRKRRTA